MPRRRLAVVVVAHPDDEVLWTGGLILSKTDTDWFVVTLCRASDPDRAARFARVIEHLGVTGAMGDLNDGPDQEPLPEQVVEEAIASLLPARAFDLVLTHGPRGEYTRHRRHEEVCRAVVTQWWKGKLSTRSLWMFAYEDGGKQYLPRPANHAHRELKLPEVTWREKYRLVTEVYGFGPESWEARVTPRVEAFWCFDSVTGARVWMNQQGIEL